MNDNAPGFEAIGPAYPTDQPSRVDQVLTWGAKKAKLCGYGPDLNWSVRFADALFVDCACCLVWRGVVVGALGGGVAGLIVGRVSAWLF